MKTLKRLLVILLIITVLLGAAGYFYVNDYYHASSEVQEIIRNSSMDIIEEDKDILFVPDDPEALLIFYPGGKVEHTAYVPLMEKLAEKGILCILVRMPGNLAVLDMNAADRYRDLYPEIKNRYLAGHSLGGVMAASYLSKHSDKYAGLILLGSYSTDELSDLKILSIYGSEDGVLDKDKYTENLKNLHGVEEYVIEGGNHCQFGFYGFQKGDNEALIDRDKQIQLTADRIVSFILE